VSHWAGQLPTIDTNTLPALTETARTRRGGPAEIERSEVTHRRQPTRRQFLDQRRVANAAEQLGRLPAPGETCHCVMRGNFDAFDLIPAIIRMGQEPATELNIATLGFNERNTTKLIELLDAGQVQKLTFICSVYFRSMKDSGRTFRRLVAELEARGQRVRAIRCHAKIQLIETASGAYVIESSANLRSCHNIEQFTLTHDRALLEFHRAWMLEVLVSASEEGI